MNIKIIIIIAAVGLLVAVGAVGGVLKLSGSDIGGEDEPEYEEEKFIPDVVANLDQVSGTTAEGETTKSDLTFGTFVLKRVTVTLTWSDDMSESQPDDFELTLNSPDGARTVASGEGGELTAVIDVPEEGCCLTHGEPGRGGSRSSSDYESISCAKPQEGWYVDIRLVDAGDGAMGPLGLVTQEDTKNPWTFGVEYIYCGNCGTAEGEDNC